MWTGRSGTLFGLCVTLLLLASCGDAPEEDAEPSLLTQGANDCHSWARSRLQDGERIQFPTGDDERVSLYEGRYRSPDGPSTVELGTPYIVLDSSDAVVEESEFSCVVVERGGGIERLALSFRD